MCMPVALHLLIFTEVSNVDNFVVLMCVVLQGEDDSRRCIHISKGEALYSVMNTVRLREALYARRRLHDVLFQTHK